MKQYLIFLRLHNQHPLGGVWRGRGRETYGNFISSYNINLSGNEFQPCKGNISRDSGYDHGAWSLSDRLESREWSLTEVGVEHGRADIVTPAPLLTQLSVREFSRWNTDQNRWSLSSSGINQTCENNFWQGRGKAGELSMKSFSRWIWWRHEKARDISDLQRWFFAGGGGLLSKAGQPFRHPANYWSNYQE